MFCEKCGKQIPENSAFCEACGAPVKPAQQEQPVQNEQPAPQPQVKEPAPAPQPQMEQPAPQQPAPQPQVPPVTKQPSKVSEFMNKLFPKPFVLTKELIILGSAALGLLAAIIAVICVIVALSNNIAMDDYLTVKNTGFDKYGYVEYDVDYDALVAEVTGESIPSSETDIQSWSDLMSAATSSTAYDDLRSAVSIDITYPADKTDGKLANGDVVVFNITFDPMIAAKYDIDVDPVTVEHEVADLGEAKVFNVMENVTLSFSGYNGAGKYTVAVNDFEKKVGNVTFTQDSYDPQSIRFEDGGELSGSIYVYVSSDTDGLSNGDKVTLTTDSVTAETLSEHGIIFDGLTKEYTVEGLAESKEFDVMSNFEIKTYGVDGEGNAAITSKDSTVTVGDVTFTTYEDDNNKIYYSSDDSYYGSGSIYLWFDGSTSDLSNGDTVKVYADVEADRLGEYGVILTNLTKEITVSGLGKYMAKLADATTDSMTALGKECMDDLENRLYEDWADVVHDDWWDDYDDQVIGDDMKVYKTILTTPKNTNSYDKNTLWVVISVTLKDDSMEKDTVYYFYYAFDDMAVDTDGKLSYSEDDDVTKSYGYTDYDEMYDDRIEEFNLNIEVSK